MQILSPAADTTIVVPDTAVWPSIPFQTDADGAHTWNWQVSWGSFQESGVAQTDSNQWDAQESVTNYGGTLTVTAACGDDSASVTLQITGTNPTQQDVTDYLATQSGSAGFDKILMAESRGRNFGSNGLPIKSFDNGYGMCQLTTPVPSYDQVWNWQNNIQAGLQLFSSKVKAATSYLGQAGRSYTDAQVMYDAVSLWNGGHYFVWDADSSQWQRNPNVLCDSATGNIGWDMTNPNNAGQSESDLHTRDAATYATPRAPGRQWGYFGVCYADHLLGPSA